VTIIPGYCPTTWGFPSKRVSKVVSGEGVILPSSIAILVLQIKWNLLFFNWPVIIFSCAGPFLKREVTSTGQIPPPITRFRSQISIHRLRFNSFDVATSLLFLLHFPSPGSKKGGRGIPLLIVISPSRNCEVYGQYVLRLYSRAVITAVCIASNKCDHLAV